MQGFIGFLNYQNSDIVDSIQGNLIDVSLTLVYWNCT